MTPTLHDDGYTAMRLRAPLLQRVSDEQIFLLDHQRQSDRLEVDRLIDRLRLRLGTDAAVRVELVQSHLPERAWAPAKDPGDEPLVRERSKAKRLEEMPPGRANVGAVRPLHLLATPAAVRVMVTPSHDAEGRPAAFVYDHLVHEATHVTGPERIAGCWWDSHDKTRDYFEVEDLAGRRFWIFRVAQTGKWYLHGSYQ